MSLHFLSDARARRKRQKRQKRGAQIDNAITAALLDKQESNVMWPPRTRS